jgi:hypothetical protein
MALFELFRAPSRTAPAAAAAPAVPVEAARLELQVAAADLAAGWQPQRKRLVIATPEALDASRRVVARITCLSSEHAMTVSGTVRQAQRLGSGWRAEIEPDVDLAKAMDLLLKAVRGEAPGFRVRDPRYLAALPAVVTTATGTTFMTTFSVSAGGCGLVWTGESPRVGGGIHVRIGAGSRAPAFRAMICWQREERHRPRVGVRFLAGHDALMASLIEEVRRDGAVAV